MLNNIYKVFKDSSLDKILKKNSEKMVVVLYNKNVDYTINVLKKLASKFSDVIFIYAKFEEPLVAIYYREQCLAEIEDDFRILIEEAIINIIGML